MRTLIVFGTRPEAIKMAPVITALRAHPGFEVSVCTTGQHREMVESILELFGIAPDHDLKIMRPGQNLNELFSHAMTRVDELLAIEGTERVLVHGDTTTSAAASLAAFHRRIPVAHVEAGLRTGRFDQPWPEEMNRRIADMVADHLFAPTEQARSNLEAESLGNKIITVTGNTVIDALLQIAALIDSDKSTRDRLDRAFPFLSSDRRLILFTCHRRESFGQSLENVCMAISDIARRGDVDIICPVHMNPNVRGPMQALLRGSPAIHLVEPLDYLSFVYLMSRCWLILTDSGGIQEEAPSLGKPVLVLRDVTERPEAVSSGVVRLVGTNRERIVRVVTEYLDIPELTSIKRTNPYGDGKAAQRIAEVLGT